MRIYSNEQWLLPRFDNYSTVKSNSSWRSWHVKADMSILKRDSKQKSNDITCITERIAKMVLRRLSVILPSSLGKNSRIE